MKTSQLKDSKISSHAEQKPHIIVKCIKDQPAIHVCSNADCNKYSFVCVSPDCQCNQQHTFCSLIFIKNLVQVLRKKTITLKPIEQTISIEFDKIIDKISEIRDSLIKQCQKSLSNYSGLQPFQSDFLKALETQQVQDIRGKDIFKIQMNIKSLTKTSKYFEKSHQKVKDLIKKINFEVDEVNKNIQNQIDRLINEKSKANFFKSKIIIKNEHQNMIEQFFSKYIQQSKLLYRASENGFLVDKFHEQCDGRNNILIICETEYGKLLGAYTPFAWDTKGDWVVDSTKQSFLFSLTKNVKFNQVNTTNTIFFNHTYGPYFGYPSDFSISNQANTNNCTANFASSFTNSLYPGNNQNTNLQILGSANNTFKVKEWEVFQLQFA